MPNHVTTVCTVTGPEADVARFQAEHFPEDGQPFDFNRIIPMPEILRDTESGSTSTDGARLILLEKANPFTTEHGLYPKRWEGICEAVEGSSDMRLPEIATAYLDANPDYRAKGMLQIQAIAATGFPSWYEWANENWRTKWNAYSVEPMDEDGRFAFQTAWDFPQPIFAKLIDKWPTLTFACLVFDEGWNFAAKGKLGADAASDPFRFVDADADLFEQVYGYAPDMEEND